MILKLHSSRFHHRTFNDRERADREIVDELKRASIESPVKECSMKVFCFVCSHPHWFSNNVMHLLFILIPASFLISSVFSLSVFHSVTLFPLVQVPQTENSNKYMLLPISDYRPSTIKYLWFVDRKP